ncbi:MAG TPA: hypothetical protein VH309_11970 [Elusimicrobiota bacterium]|nr:hypothetical protein [Elusimicrobiota bacterium]
MDCEPATKADLKQALGGLDGRFSSIDDRFNSIDAKFTSIDAKFSALDAKFTTITRNLAIEMTKSQDDIREMKSVMSTKADIDRVMSAISVFAARTEDHSRAIILHGQALTEATVALKDHNRRISALESRPA